MGSGEGTRSGGRGGGGNSGEIGQKVYGEQQKRALNGGKNPHCDGKPMKKF